MRGTLRLFAAALLVVPVFAGTATAAEHFEQTQKVGQDEVVSTVLGGPSTSTTVVRPGSWYLKAHFTGLRLVGGDVLTVANPAGTESYRYTSDVLASGTASKDATGFWAMSVTGDQAVVSIKGRDGGRAHPASRVKLDKITRGYTEAELAASVGPQSICGANDYKDAVCYQTSNPTEFGRTKAVAKLLRNGGSLCTAWRVGPNNKMLTNNHCFTSGTGIEVWFNYQCATCGSTTSATVTKVLVQSVLKTSTALDYTLFSVTNFADISSFGYLELDARVPAVGEEMYVIGHPAGKLKKLSLRDDQNAGGYCKVSAVRVNGDSAQSDIAYRCDTEGGSSGSPVLSRQTHKVVGLHHWGGCPNQGVRIDLIAAQINPVL
ncbi:serine protease [Actinosynnema sp. NPDC047251]|uniref:Bacterial pre-peptidase C-terminal domain protein n=1 Tax=Saccharothrix espanaensis (strain ATCC 51144 / DSM 44229 / JCM 9112 / NBRC 15066 / NRRL 15764) TaxID=1179773 RepID=K0KG26_SACES|nr:serine protease [Saccharothrix espanaensis]CCH35473.1 Bacterial pre-peptidase C-terminal domain protein [Saccharothrix espanaensis DSM 44229]